MSRVEMHTMRTFLGAEFLLALLFCLGCTSNGSVVESTDGTEAPVAPVSDGAPPQTPGGAVPDPEAGAAAPGSPVDAAAPAEAQPAAGAAAQESRTAAGDATPPEKAEAPPDKAEAPPEKTATDPGKTAEGDDRQWVLLPLEGMSVAVEGNQHVVEVTCRTPSSGWDVKLRVREGSDSESAWREYEILGREPAKPPEKTEATTRKAVIKERLSENVKSVLVYGKGGSLLEQVPENE